MNEWLTTGRVLDKLLLGEIAECESDSSLKIRNIDNAIYYVDQFGYADYEKGAEGNMIINSYIRDCKWRILPTYISFEEAMKALKEGKRVRLLSENGKHLLPPFEKEHMIQNCDGIGRSFQSWFEGKWTIEGDTQ